jgi:rhomboid family GlyGly-CTERM serine protease
VEAGLRLNPSTRWLAWLARPGVAWCALSALLALGAWLGAWWPRGELDWQAALAWREPWRWFSAAWVHADAPHLIANLAGACVLAVFGLAARCPWREALAWAVAWPLTHGLLLLQPALTHYAGLSGVLHAGVAVAAGGLILRERSRARALGALVLGGLLIKLLGEEAWVAPVREQPGWDFPVAVLAHASGAASGALCVAVAWATSRIRALGTMPR